MKHLPGMPAEPRWVAPEVLGFRNNTTPPQWYRSLTRVLRLRPPNDSRAIYRAGWYDALAAIHNIVREELSS